MPKVEVNGVHLYYEEHGQGDPLALIPGLGLWHWCWLRQIPALSRYFRTIAIDNRGVGDSDKPDEPYTIEGMADEAAAVLRALGGGPAHVLGFSMGGYIAQELALRHPDQVASLILVSTGPGGPDQVEPDAEVQAAMRIRTSQTPEENLRRQFPYAVAPGYFDAHPEELEELIRLRLQKPTPVHVYVRQHEATRRWRGLGGRGAAVEVPVLIVHGDRDRLLPVENARRLAERIPGAELRLIPGAGHFPLLEAAPMVNRVILEFLLGLGPG